MHFHVHFPYRGPPIKLHRPGRLAVALFFSGMVWFLAWTLSGGSRWTILVDPQIAELTADDLIAGTPVLHPRIGLSGACIDHDSDVTYRFERKDKQGKVHRGYESVALVRRAADGRSTGWFVHTPITTATGCEAVASLSVSQGTIYNPETIEAAQALGLSPDPARTFKQGWISMAQTLLCSLVMGCMASITSGLFLLDAWGFEPGTTLNRVSRWGGVSMLLFVLVWVLAVMVLGFTS